jgi:hemoglobin
VRAPVARWREPCFLGRRVRAAWQCGGMRSVHETAGGSAGLLRLAGTWHCRVMADEVVSHAFSHRFHPQHSQRLAACRTPGPPAALPPIPAPAETGPGRADPQRQWPAPGGGPARDRLFRPGDARRPAGTRPGLCGRSCTTIAPGHHDPNVRYPGHADEVPEGMSLRRWSWNGLHH